ncbi:MAG: hypothetical protein A2324_14480 [Candidatus Raymondbacteria bacterium RIFOXYB2_FULL_49_35]|nr:MAG: hypothetical protein A2453_09720 [Candidatus Raymondbacteria bacterium RIFOXYC2_FULL_50_21]OGP43669.1 MAG: hypothetical protein A2324_14480 [Candidatus Raymondbacteria bacterium RIFOXYB2_FULL_49_35]
MHAWRIILAQHCPYSQHKGTSVQKASSFFLPCGNNLLYFYPMKYSIPIILLFILSPLFNCSSIVMMNNKVGYRKVHAAIIVDPTYTVNQYWRQNLEMIVDKVNEVYGSWFDIVFIVDTMYEYDMSKNPDFYTMHEIHALIKNVPKGSADIVIHFSKEKNMFRYDFAGIASSEFGYVQIKQMNWTDAREPFQMAYYTLLHELAHLFGAMHVYPVKNTSFVMEPRLSYYVLDYQGKGVTIIDPEFHPGNTAIIRALALRPFQDTNWSERKWPVIAEAYRSVCETYNGGGMDAEGLDNFYNQTFYQQEPYLYLSTWASLCGRDSLAIAYIDSFVSYAAAIKTTCASTRAGGRTREMCGALRRYGDIWFEIQEIFSHYNKAEVLVRAGKLAESDAEMNQFITMAKKQNYTLLDTGKLEAFYSWLREKARNKKILLETPADSSSIPVDN